MSNASKAPPLSEKVAGGGMKEIEEAIEALELKTLWLSERERAQLDEAADALRDLLGRMTCNGVIHKDDEYHDGVNLGSGTYRVWVERVGEE